MSVPIHVLMWSAFGGGGVARTVLNLVNQLVEHHDVEVISLLPGDKPRFPIDPRVRLRVLMEPPNRRGLIDRGLSTRPSRLHPEPSTHNMSRLTDRRLRQALRSLDGGILLSTRPTLHLAAVRYASPSVKVVGQEHLNVPTRWANPVMVDVLTEVVPRIDSYVVLTEADATDYRRMFPEMRGDLRVIHNALPWSVPEEVASLDSRIVVAAGRLAPAKGFDRLVDAFEPVARDHPDWRLRIYGTGPLGDRLRDRVRNRRLEGQVELMGYSDDMRATLAEASVFALTSRKEGFGMVLTEAMSVGVPLVAFDCPRGPGEIVQDGRNGFLVPDGDVPGFTSALRRLVEDGDLRRRMGAAGHTGAHAYEMEAIVAQWEQLFDDVMALPHR